MGGCGPKQHFLSYLMIKVFQIVPSSASVASSHVSKPSAAGPPRNMMVGGEQPGSICVSSVELSSPSCEDTWDNSSYKISNQSIIIETTGS